jgi:hypothetical protein
MVEDNTRKVGNRRMQHQNTRILVIAALCITFANRPQPSGAMATARQPRKERSSDEGCGRSPSEALPVARLKLNEPLTVLKAMFSRLGQTLAFCGKCAIFCEGAFPAHKI